MAAEAATPTIAGYTTIENLPQLWGKMPTLVRIRMKTTEPRIKSQKLPLTARTIPAIKTAAIIA